MEVVRWLEGEELAPAVELLEGEELDPDRLVVIDEEGDAVDGESGDATAVDVGRGEADDFCLVGCFYSVSEVGESWGTTCEFQF